MKRDLPFDVNDAQLQAALARKLAAAIEMLADVARSSLTRSSAKQRNI